MWRVSVAQSCLTLCDAMDCSLPDFSVHGILQARILEWVACPFSRVSSQPSDWTQVSGITVVSLVSEPRGKSKDQNIFLPDKGMGQRFIKEEWALFFI